MSQLDQFFAYQIGDIVTHKGMVLDRLIPKHGLWNNLSDSRTIEPQRFVILERLLQECHGGIQKHYLCRVVSVEDRGAAMIWESFQITEAEVCPLPPPQPAEEGHSRQAKRKAEEKSE